jgi:predicted RNA-binding protein
MSPVFKPYRVDVEFSACREAPIKPLIERLSFIRSKTHWGGAFRFGYVKVPEADFARIADAMKPASSSRSGA